MGGSIVEGTWTNIWTVSIEALKKGSITIHNKKYSIMKNKHRFTQQQKYRDSAINNNNQQIHNNSSVTVSWTYVP